MVLRLAFNETKLLYIIGYYREKLKKNGTRRMAPLQKAGFQILI
jgi:hypothetical protein